MKGKPINLIGERFDKLLVVELFESTPSGKSWMCMCDCGNLVIKLTTQLRRKGRISGGCRECERDSRSQVKIKHGGCKFGKSLLYMIWKTMRSRCYNPSHISYEYYGGKGISVCEEWKNSFETFKNWAVCNGYEEHLSIERINSNLNYCPSNCKWITRSENTRRARQKAVI